ncbi:MULTISPECIES: thioredoxin family protein [unclassified Erwinia]|uniref:thioredoxin family protein n=1 Tax=unclassified Erwinia TaxID=2622719 RepID=UPI0006F6A3F3|nr:MULTISPECIES: thioredoxin family protein [unclassified Erwinia]KQN55592.1 hypothetical protein ASF13_08810 [Erwinia sp. Leaf53]PLV63871.1 hypothetical protein NV64_01225 [Erwinia sp. B116]
MADFKTLFGYSVDYAEFVSQGSAEEIAALRRDQDKTQQADFLSPELEAQIAALKGRFTLLVAAEMWCPDCQRNLPAIRALTQRYPDAQLGILNRAQADAPFKDAFGVERVKIPFVAVLDEEFAPLGSFIERPQSVVTGGDEALQSYKRGERLAETVGEIVGIMRQNA